MKRVSLFVMLAIIFIISFASASNKYSTYIEYTAESRATYGPCG